MEDPNTVQGAEPQAEDLSAPDFALLDESQPNANDQAGAPEGETSKPEEGEPKDEATPEQSEETKEPELAASPSFDELRKEFPDLTPAAVREALLRDKNLQSGYNKKFMELADQRKALEAERETIKQTHDLLASEAGKLAVEVAKAMQDPSVEARLRKAYDAIQLDPNDPSKVYIDRQTEPIRRQLEEMKRQNEAMQQANIQRQAEATHKYIQEQAKSKGVNPDYLFMEVDKLATAHKLNGGDLTEQGLLAKLTEQAADLMAKAREADRLSYLEQWKKDKANAQQSAPPPTSGGSAPASAQKDPGDMTADELLQESIRMLS